MSEYHIVVLVAFLSGATFVIVVGLVVLLLRRKGHSVEVHDILERIDQTRNQIGRQLGVMDAKQDSHMRAMSAWLKTLLDRFGFLTAKPKPPKTDFREDKFK